jgi:hypothetical protein
MERLSNTADARKVWVPGCTALSTISSQRTSKVEPGWTTAVVTGVSGAGDQLSSAGSRNSTMRIAAPVEFVSLAVTTTRCPGAAMYGETETCMSASPMGWPPGATLRAVSAVETEP